MYTPPTSYLVIFAITKALLPLWVRCGDVCACA